MLLPKRMPIKLAIVVCPAIGFLHGLVFGVLYAPAQALLFGLSFRQMLTWIAVGFPWDIIHGIGNLVMSVIIVPLFDVLKKLENRSAGFLGNH